MGQQLKGSAPAGATSVALALAPPPQVMGGSCSLLADGAPYALAGVPEHRMTLPLLSPDVNQHPAHVFKRLVHNVCTVVSTH